ncbi:helix-turn-helix domain-containing protein [Streptacidiphilus sp. PB12-B1b]|uniref:helix-turn-helix domain-containing protein n=1 Tax=Streptacidiphilus sp. PB12-B1b TaxID=2705012 RepID=UPI0015FE3934|nr:helix-turn-helix transcriptional regulator [Streptacidiphilus sp. PB12-B1b]QMU78638.1 helix-turn-helix domain-containing protein [Streptacidiphilus sp. PB12-B1b]
MARPKKPQSPPNGAAVLWGEELQFWRSQAGLTQGQLAARIPCDQSWISGLENGKAVATAAIATQIDGALGTGGVLLRSLKYVVREATSGFYPDWFKQYVALEAQAVTLHEWYPMSMPGLLQTELYMRHQLALWGHSPERVNELTEARLSRQELLRGTTPLRVLAVLHESVLHNQVGGPKVMAHQLAHLLRMTCLPSVTVQVVPAQAPLLTWLDSTVALVGMPDGETWSYAEALDRGWVTKEPAAVQGTVARYDRVRASALSAHESREVIRRAMGELVNMTPAIDLSKVSVFKSSYSGGNAGCVGTTRDLVSAGLAPVVDTTLGLASPVLPFTTAAFASFVAAVKAGEFPAGEKYVTA